MMHARPPEHSGLCTKIRSVKRQIAPARPLTDISNVALRIRRGLNEVGEEPERQAHPIQEL